MGKKVRSIVANENELRKFTLVTFFIRPIGSGG